MSYREHADALADLVSSVSNALNAPKGTYAAAWKARANKAIAALRKQELADRQGDLLSRGAAPSPAAAQESAQAELRTAAEDVLRGGDHEGPCDNEDEHPAVRGPCDAHWRTAKARKERLRRALDEVTETDQPATTTTTTDETS